MRKNGLMIKFFNRYKTFCNNNGYFIYYSSAVCNVLNRRKITCYQPASTNYELVDQKQHIKKFQNGSFSLTNQNGRVTEGF